MKIVVTGGTSFIGVPVIRRLLELGHHVYAIVRPGSANLWKLPDDKGLPGSLIVLPVQLGDMDRIGEHIPESCDLCFHFGWDGAGSENRTNRAVQQQNVEDSVRVLEGAAALGCRRFLFSGSQAEYGIHQEPMTEDTVCRPLSEYGRAKVDFKCQAEELCRRKRVEGIWDMEYVHTRIFSIYGPGDHPWSLVESCLRIFLEGGEIKLGECTQQWNFLYIEDLVGALLSLGFFPEALDQGQGAVFNIAGGAKETKVLRGYVEQMYELCGKKGSFTYGQRAPNAEGPANLIPDITRIGRVTGWKPLISFEQGIKKMLKERQR